jgi:hypothetical protein
VLPHLLGYDSSALSWSWDFDDATTRLLHEELDLIAAEGSDCGAELMETLGIMRDEIGDLTGTGIGPMPVSPPTPRLSESWFCCAEPTAAQATAIGLTIGRVSVKSE